MQIELTDHQQELLQTAYECRDLETYLALLEQFTNEEKGRLK